MSLYSRRWFCALSGSVRGHVSEFRNAYKERYDCLSLRADLSKKIVLAVSGQARREAPASVYASIWQQLSSRARVWPWQVSSLAESSVHYRVWLSFLSAVLHAFGLLISSYVLPCST